MSMHEAIKNWRNVLPWLIQQEEQEFKFVPLPTPTESTEALVVLAKGAGYLDLTSDTWRAVASWAAKELIAAQADLESTNKVIAVQARIRTLRDLLALKP